MGWDDEDELEGLADDDGGDGASLAEEAEVACPWCGEAVTIGLDAGGGEEQTYVEDCQVCCRPWVVHVTFGEDGSATVHVEAVDQ
ncbi:MAG: CPXCG motif-containing cysteine-rich protein [Gemmatimonadales bacterium]|nr:CPXCG motif-containing cysteine-rich protein [Gemmatimonadales bacterium]